MRKIWLINVKMSQGLLGFRKEFCRTIVMNANLQAYN